MEPTDITIEILKDIRSAIGQTNERLDRTNDRLEQMNSRIDQTNHSLFGTNERIDSLRDELSRRIVESEIRTSTAITALAGTVSEMTDVLRASHDLRPRVERCEQDIVDLKRRLP
jgi:methyl-accepting chemotaxis protein